MFTAEKPMQDVRICGQQLQHPYLVGSNLLDDERKEEKKAIFQNESGAVGYVCETRRFCSNPLQRHRCALQHPQLNETSFGNLVIFSPEKYAIVMHRQQRNSSGCFRKRIPTNSKRGKSSRKESLFFEKIASYFAWILYLLLHATRPLLVRVFEGNPSMYSTTEFDCPDCC